MTRTERQARRKMADKNPKGPMKRLYTVAEAAFYLGRTVNSLRETIWAGKIPIVRDGRRILLDIRDLDTFIEKNKTVFTF